MQQHPQRDLALTVIQLEPGEFHWVLMEPIEAASEDVLCYAPVESSSRHFREYGEALIVGAVALRQLQALAFALPSAAPALAVDRSAPTLPAAL